jgi:ethanolamine utilization protein EutA
MSEGGRVFFSRSRLAASRETIRLTSLGIDIGSTTTHLVLSRLAVERRGGHSEVVSRQVLHRSPVLLTPYDGAGSLDAAMLRRFLDDVMARAVIDPDAIDTGALILTGIAARQDNARALGEELAFASGRLVALAAGDALETRLAAHGSGAVAASVGRVVLHVDIGGGTSKIARCVDGRIQALTAVAIGARTSGDVAALLAAMGLAPMTAEARSLHLLPPLTPGPAADLLSVSGGVAEYLFGRESHDFGDQGQALAQSLGVSLHALRITPIRLAEGLRATVMGASQHSARLSGATVYAAPPDILPLQRLRLAAPDFDLGADTLDPATIAEATRLALLGAGDDVAIAYRWQGSATHARLDAFCRGLALAMPDMARLVLVGDRDIGGLLGVHAHREARVAPCVVSLDGIEAGPLDWIDIGAMLEGTGAVPVVVTSLLFGG